MIRYRSISRNTKSVTNSLTRAVLDLLAANHCLAWRQNNAPVPITETDDDGRRVIRGFRRASVRAGVPDIIGVAPDGTVLLVEVKRDRDILSADQRRFMKLAADNRAFVMVVRKIDDLLDLTSDEPQWWRRKWNTLPNWKEIE